MKRLKYYGALMSVLFLVFTSPEIFAQICHCLKVEEKIEHAAEPDVSPVSTQALYIGGVSGTSFVFGVSGYSGYSGLTSKTPRGYSSNGWLNQ